MSEDNYINKAVVAGSISQELMRLWSCRCNGQKSLLGVCGPTTHSKWGRRSTGWDKSWLWPLKLWKPPRTANPWPPCETCACSSPPSYWKRLSLCPAWIFHGAFCGHCSSLSCLQGWECLHSLYSSHLGVAVGSSQKVPASCVPEKTGLFPSASPCGWCPWGPWPLGTHGWTLLGPSGSCTPDMCRVALPGSSQAGITPSLGSCPLQVLPQCLGPFLQPLLGPGGTALHSCPGPDEVWFGPTLVFIFVCLCLCQCCHSLWDPSLPAPLLSDPLPVCWGCALPQLPGCWWVFGALGWPLESCMAKMQLRVQLLIAAVWSRDLASFPSLHGALGTSASSWVCGGRPVLKSKNILWAIQLSSEPPRSWLCSAFDKYLLTP